MLVRILGGRARNTEKGSLRLENKKIFGVFACVCTCVMAEIREQRRNTENKEGSEEGAWWDEGESIRVY